MKALLALGAFVLALSTWIASDGPARDVMTNRIAAEFGDPAAQYRLAVKYLKGEVVGQDYVAARKWFLLSAAGGYYQSPHELGQLYLRGMGVARDPVRAMMWMHIGVAMADSEALKDAIIVERSLSASQLAQVQAQALACTAKELKGCE